MFKETAVFLTLIVVARCGDPYQTCGDSVECVEEQMVKVVDNLDQQKEVSILGDVVVLEKVEEVKETGKSSGDLVDRLMRYIDEHQIRVKMPQSVRQSRSLEEEGRKRKIRKLLLPLLLFFKLKAAIVLPAVLAAIALVAFKGLGVSFLSLAVAGIAAFKAFADSHFHSSSKVSYEIVPQVAPAPGWSRTAANPLENWASPAFQPMP